MLLINLHLLINGFDIATSPVRIGCECIQHVFEVQSIDHFKGTSLIDVRFVSACSVHQAQAALRVGLEKLVELDIPITRPSNYFAEMVKTDDHMRRVGFGKYEYLFMLEEYLQESNSFHMCVCVWFCGC